MNRVLPLLFVLTLCGPVAAQDLPPDILADQYLLEATKALENGDPQAAIRTFEKIEALDTEPPLEFLFFYGKLLVENSTVLDDLLKGQSLLKSYVISIEKDSEHYTPTLELLAVVGAKLEKAEAERRAERRAEQQRQAEEAKHQAEAKRQAEVERKRQAKLKKQRPRLLANIQNQMVHIEGGTFTMGCREGFFSDDKDCRYDEKPAHRVQVSSFEISKYEVTQELWEVLMGENPSSFKGCAQCPVEEVSWEGTRVFLRQLNGLTGEKYRLPTEAEWEYAARGGQQSRGYRYAGSDDLSTVAWHGGNSGDKTHPVGQKQPNELGLYDMSGNVSEWVQDWYDSDYYSSSPVSDPQGPPSGTNRVYRGGGWRGTASSCRAEDRGWTLPFIAFNSLGFRLAKSP